ncbi:MAG: hypothetical protein WBE97_07845 [Candidatus Acidiferrales bacterium]
MRPKDVRECVEIVAAHPITGPRYANSLGDLRTAWLRLLSSDGFCSAMVFEDVEEGSGRARSRMAGIGVTVCVSGDFLREVKTPPFFWIGPELAKRVARGDSPLLSEKQLREANSGSGLNLMVWHACIRMEAIKRVEVWQELMTTFLDEHRGFLFSCIAVQADSLEHLEGIRNTGGRLLKPASGRYEDFEGKNLGEIISEPHILGLTRQTALEQLGSWIGLLFVHEPPRFGFSRSEQRLLLAALAGGTDEELSEQLGIALSTTKKMWRSVYHRVAAINPELIPNDSREDGVTSKRGKSKKQRLMTYLRDHREELRPVSRNLLQHRTVPVRGRA